MMLDVYLKKLARMSTVRLVLIGAALLIAGFAYHVVFAGVPYQDPTPEMTARYERDSLIGTALAGTGLGILLIGMVVAALRSRSQRSGQAAAG